MLFRNRSYDDLAQWALIVAVILALDYCFNPTGIFNAIAVLIRA